MQCRRVLYKNKVFYYNLIIFIQSWNDDMSRYQRFNIFVKLLLILHRAFIIIIIQNFVIKLITIRMIKNEINKRQNLKNMYKQYD